ncbi:hypothetical protein Leryth_024123 [Lithospermum erythrorhizon]|nr:hypothetical protein Leryth_024123 [Lithospermum erythrorhizon]
MQLIKSPPPPPSPPSTAAPPPPTTPQDTELLFRTKPISEIRNVEAQTRKQIEWKSEELRQLVGNRYRDLIDSADTILEMKKSCESISVNISSIRSSILDNLAFSDPPKSSYSPARAKSYDLACRVKYLVDTPENIWGCLDESMFLEASARYKRAKYVHFELYGNGEYRKALCSFPLLQHQWQIVQSFKVQISQKSRERLLDQEIVGVGIGDYADALSAVGIIDELDPKQVLDLFLDSRRNCISQKLSACSQKGDVTSEDVICVLCEVLRIIQVSVGQVGELFLQVLNDMPLFYKTILGSPPASQLFGGIPNPDEEVRLWNSFREKLESVMVMLDKGFIAKTCSEWLKTCGKEIMNKINGHYLIDVIGSGRELASAEKLIRETMDSKQVLEGSLEWLKSVFGSEIELPWKRTRELVLGDDSDLYDDIFEHAFMRRMKAIIDSGFDELSTVVNVAESVRSIADGYSDGFDFQAYLHRSAGTGGVWFTESNIKKIGILQSIKNQQLNEKDFSSCLNAYLGVEVSRIRDAVDNCCENVLMDLLSFLESPKASLRLRDLASYVQQKCYGSMTAILDGLKNELDQLYASLENAHKEVPPAALVERALFIGRLLFAFQKHTKYIPLILGSPRSWVNKTIATVPLKSLATPRYSRMIDSPVSKSPAKKVLESSNRHDCPAMAALFGVEDSPSPQLEELSRTTQDLCIKAHTLWISWFADELSSVLAGDLKQDAALSMTSSLRGWEETVVKEEHSTEGQSEMRILLPSMPSIYVISFLFEACEEIHRVGGHVLDRRILMNFSSNLMDKVIAIYGKFLSDEDHLNQVSEKGILQLLFDLRFIADVLSVGDLPASAESPRILKVKVPYRRRQESNSVKSVIGERIAMSISRLSQRLDPIDWLTYEPYLWENEKQSYLKHAVLFGFFVQVNRAYTDTTQKFSTSSESNIMRCSTVPRFKYLPISAPALSSRGPIKASTRSSSDDVSSRNSWKSYSGDDLQKIDGDDSSSMGVATPFLKSFMQAGSRFGESTLRLGSILTDGQVGRFGDILPVQAAGLLSSFTATRSDS